MQQVYKEVYMMGLTVIAFANAINSRNSAKSQEIFVKKDKYPESPESREKRHARRRSAYHKKKGSEQGVCKFCGDVVFYNSRAGRMPIACAKMDCKRKSKKQGGKFKETYGTV